MGTKNVNMPAIDYENAVMGSTETQHSYWVEKRL